MYGTVMEPLERVLTLMPSVSSPNSMPRPMMAGSWVSRQALGDDALEEQVKMHLTKSDVAAMSRQDSEVPKPRLSWMGLGVCWSGRSGLLSCVAPPKPASRSNC